MIFKREKDTNNTKQGTQNHQNEKEKKREENHQYMDRILKITHNNIDG